MKKYTLLLTMSLLVSIAASGQSSLRYEIGLNAGYLVNGGLHFQEGYMSISDAATYQINVSSGFVGGRSDLEFEYKLTPKQKLDFVPYLNYNDPIDPFSAHFTNHTFGLNGLTYFTGNEITRPYIVYGLYASVYDFDTHEINTRTSMAFRIGAGLKQYFTDRFGIKIQASFNAPIQFRGSGLYASIGTGGSDVGLSLNSSVIYPQGDFLLGFLFRF